jgi:hypothetical protein
MPIISLNLSIQNYSSLDGGTLFYFIFQNFVRFKNWRIFLNKYSKFTQSCCEKNICPKYKLLDCNYSPKEDAESGIRKESTTCEASAAVLSFFIPLIFYVK